MPTDTGTDRVTSRSRPLADSFNDRFLRAGLPAVVWLLALWMAAHDRSGQRPVAGPAGLARWGFLVMGGFVLVYAWTRRRGEDARWDVLTFAALTLMFYVLS